VRVQGTLKWPALFQRLVGNLRETLNVDVVKISLVGMEGVLTDVQGFECVDVTKGAKK